MAIGPQGRLFQQWAGKVVWYFLSALSVASMLYFPTVQFVPNRYLSTLAVTVDIDSLPAMQEPERVASGFNSIFTSPAVLKEILDDMFYDEQRRSSPYEEALFVDNFIVKDKFDRRLIEIEASLENYTIKVDFPVRLFNDQLGKRAITAINRVARKKNEQLELIHQKTNKNIMDEHLARFKRLYQEFKDQNPKYEENRLTIKANIYQIEHELRKLARDHKIAIDQSIEMMPQKNQDIILNNYIVNTDQKQDFKIPSQEVEPAILAPVLKLLAILKNYQILTREKLAEYKQRITGEIVSGITVNDLFTDKLSIRLATIHNLQKSSIDYATPVDRSKLFLPLFELNESFYQASIQKGNIERLHSYRKLYGLFCFLTGLFVVGGVHLLIFGRRKNPATL